MTSQEYKEVLKKNKSAENYQQNRDKILERKKKYIQDVKDGIIIPKIRGKREKPVIEERICNQCKSKKFIDDFNFFSVKKNIRRKYCKTCQSDNQRDYIARKQAEKINDILNS
jgi:hypothetical protein